MNTLLFVNATIGFSEKLSLVFSNYHNNKSPQVKQATWRYTKVISKCFS